MLLNFGKCRCLHTGHENFDVKYKMGYTIMDTAVKNRLRCYVKVI